MRSSGSNRRLIARALETAGQRKSDIVLFGEYANLHHRAWSNAKKDYVPDPIPGSFTRMVSRHARKFRMNVAMPMFGIWKGVLSNYVVLIDRRGRIAGCYQKTHPTESEQDKGMVPGNDLPVFALDCCTVGVMTCMDIEYPEVAQVLMLHGAEMLLFPHVQAGWSEADWEVRYRARAVDTGLCLVSACLRLSGRRVAARKNDRPQRRGGKRRPDRRGPGTGHRYPDARYRPGQETGHAVLFRNEE